MTPSDSTFRWLARSVEPVVVMSTMTSAEPAGRGAFGGAQAFDDAVDLDAVLLREELLRQPPVFGGDAQPPAVALAEIGGDVIEIGHRHDVEPAFRHGDHDVGPAEAQPGCDLGLRARSRRGSRAADPRR